MRAAQCSGSVPNAISCAPVVLFDMGRDQKEYIIINHWGGVLETVTIMADNAQPLLTGGSYF